jgi:hypothetical protein
LNFGSAAFYQTVAKHIIPFAAMESSSRKQTLVWQKKGATLQISHVVEAAPAHKVGLAKQLQQIAAQRQQKLNMNASSFDLIAREASQTSNPSINKEASERCNDS